VIASRRALRAAELRAERAAADAAAARGRAAALEAALDLLPQGVVVQPVTGAAIRNSSARAMAASHSADVLAEHALKELLEEAAGGRAASRSLELRGPPRRVLALFAGPLESSDGTRLGVGGVVEDVTERHRIDAVRRDFVANVSHELRTPIGALSVLADTMADHDDAEVIRRLAVRVGAESRRATRLVEDLLDLSRIEAAGSARFEEVGLVEAVNAAVARVADGAAERGTSIEVTVPPGTAVLGDGGQLVSAIANLVDNAVKYSPPGSVVRVHAVDEPDAVVVTVRDEGIGIPRRDLERIFERFYRVDQARSRETGGTGLGLAIVRHVAENHAGSVSVESTEGVGSTFTFRLPKTERTAE
jgi:two-component system sensor histidine kinase SenX3